MATIERVFLRGSIRIKVNDCAADGSLFACGHGHPTRSACRNKLLKWRTGSRERVLAHYLAELAGSGC